MGKEGCTKHCPPQTCKPWFIMWSNVQCNTMSAASLSCLQPLFIAADHKCVFYKINQIKN